MAKEIVIVAELYPARDRVQLIKENGSTKWTTLGMYDEFKKTKGVRFIENINLEVTSEQRN